MATLSGEASAEIDPPIERCWAVVQDVAVASEGQHALERVDVIERDDRGRPLVCAATTNTKISRFTTRVRFEYEEPTRLSWMQVGKSDLRSMRGAWELEDLGRGRTRATYRLEVDPGRIGAVIRGPVEPAIRAAVVGGRPRELAVRVATTA